MRQHRGTPQQRSAQLEDIVLAALVLLAGPLLWWMGQTWQQNPAATSIQMLEYWIALFCGFVGIGLCALSGIVIFAGLGLVIATKTKNRVVGYWAALFTPKFLQRIIISALGIQLTLGSQAYATEEPDVEPTEIASTQSMNPFMPEVAEIPAATGHDPGSSPTADITHDDESPSDASARHRPTESPAATESSAASPQPHQSDQIQSEAVPDTTATRDGDKSPVNPMPRQTTTIPVTQPSSRDDVEQKSTQPDPTKAYLPQKPMPSPYIADPNPDRSHEGPTIVIQTGDSLWDIAHQELGADSTLPQIDQRWRQWWQYNSDLIGPDPHMLSPGTILEAPPFTH